ncbi:RluA family pseudouridine synthase [Kordia algicida OT-1]|uniref:Ribosomal large subunit pseudouridine synthase D n=1 Tax=Kordia algicida OT-1 TaxID=391587 RepID=A9DVX4_9FLAO|nr:RluA family pseudouridine synthase [Kordia algicida]EDP96479.1 ribosomal large subunit pseudouridine synthase D [Kordia algicida OT-1]
MSKLEIIHENKDYIVVNKASGLISEKSPYEAVTVEDQVFQHILKSKRKPYVGIIHRLDRVTSGVLILAKKKSILVAFNKLFSSRKVQKTYLAIVKNKPTKSKGNLVNFLIKNNKEKKAEIVTTKSKEAQSCMLSYEVIGKNNIGYLLAVKPKTGRFHQIRAQLANIGLPIVGDSKYGSDVSYKSLSICLHAWKLTFEDVETKEQKTFEASLPNHDFWKFDTEVI